MGGFSLYENGKLVRSLDIFELERLEAEGKVDWPDITEEEIKDKSKGDYFSKGVVVLQTCWFIIQVIARGVEHMVVTELEVVTLAFSALTMIIYFLWWNKPLDVGVSVPVHVKDGFSLDEKPSSSPSHEHLPTTTEEIGTSGSTDEAEPSQLHTNEDDSTSRPIFTSEDEPLVSSPQDIEMQPLTHESRINSPSAPAPQHDRASISPSAKSSNKEVPAVDAEMYSKRELLWESLDSFRDLFKKHNFIVAIFLSTIGILVGIIVLIFYLLYKPLQEFVLAIAGMLTCKKLNKKSPTRVPTFYCPSSEDESITYVITIAVGIVFGSIHCIAWSFPFPSFTELWLWRINSILVATVPVAVVAIMGLASLILSGDDADEESKADEGKKGMDIGVWLTMIGMTFIIVLLLVLFLAYIGARFCLLVLPLYALRALPEGAYDDVNWTIFLPHIHI